MNYKIIYKENGNANVIFTNGENIETEELGNVNGMLPQEVDKLALQVIKANQIVPIPNVSKDLYDDLKADLELGRVQMRKVMKLMSAKELTIRDKNEMVEICKVEIASALTLGKLIKQRIDLENAYGNNKEVQK